MDRRTLLASLPLLGVAAFSGAQESPVRTAPAAPPAPAPPSAAPSPAAPSPAPVPLFNFPPPTLSSTVMAEGLKFPEAPVCMNDGSLLFVEIESKKVSRLTPDGKVWLVKQLEGGPNGLAIGPDQALYIANDGGRFSFARRGGYNFPGPPPAEHVGGSIQRLDLKSGELTTLYESCNGRRLVAPDDLVFDRAGGMWISDIGKVRGDAGIYYALTNGKNITCVKDGMSAPNGIGLSPDGKLLHVSEARRLWTFDIAAPGVLAPPTSYPQAEHAALREHSIADSLKVQADGKVCVCTLLAGGISIIDAAGATEFIQFSDPMPTNLAFGGRDMRDVWVTLSATSRIAKLRWPYSGMRPEFGA
jgi:gluconolactonase